jgi:hypothetical protein
MINGKFFGTNFFFFGNRFARKARKPVEEALRYTFYLMCIDTFADVDNLIGSQIINTY